MGRAGSSAGTDESRQPPEPAILLRMSCRNCTARRRRCVTPGPPAMCERCAKEGVECVYIPAHKPGPRPRGKTQPEPDDGEWARAALAMRNSRLQQGYEHPSRRNRARRHQSAPSVGQQSVGAPGDGGETRDLVSWSLGSVVGEAPPLDAASVTVFSKLPMRAPLALPLLPDDAIVKLVMSRYVNAFHENFPVAVRHEVLREFSTASMPDFLCCGLQFYTMWYAQDLPDALGTDLYVSMLRALFDRIQATLLPALAATLAGYDVAFPTGAENAPGPLAAVYRKQRDAYKKMAVAVIVTLMHLLVTSITTRMTTEVGPFANAKALLKLCVRAARAAKLNREDIYGEPIEDGERCVLLLERVRRAWWVLVFNDRQIATMEHTIPEIRLAECQSVGLFLSEGQYERAAAADGSGVSGSLPTLPSIPVNLRTSAAPNGIVDPLLAYARLWTFFDRILHHRRTFAKPYLDTPERLAIQADLDGWYNELPALFRSMETHALASLSIGNAVGLSSKVLGFASYTYLTYHTAQVLLSSPSEEEVWSPDISVDWVASPAFLTCQTYAARATTLLSHTLSLPERIDNLCAPFFQYGVVRCGLIHYQYFRSALAAAADSLGGASLVRDAAIQLRIHRAALIAGQMGGVRSGVVGGEEGGLTHWLAVWWRMVEGPSGELIDRLRIA